MLLGTTVLRGLLNKSLVLPGLITLGMLNLWLNVSLVLQATTAESQQAPLSSVMIMNIAIVHLMVHLVLSSKPAPLPPIPTLLFHSLK